MSFEIYDTADQYRHEYRRPLTPHQSNYVYRTADLRVPKFMMEQVILSRMKHYQKQTKSKSKKNIEWKQYKKLKEQLQISKQFAQMRDRPSISPKSAQIFTRVKQKRNLSPNILERFEKYQKQKQRKLLRMRIIKFMCETNKIPKPKDIIKDNTLYKENYIIQLIQEVARSKLQQQN